VYRTTASSVQHNGFECTGQRLWVYRRMASSLLDNGFKCTAQRLRVEWQEWAYYQLVLRTGYFCTVRASPAKETMYFCAIPYIEQKPRSFDVEDAKVQQWVSECTGDRDRNPSLSRISAALWSMNWQHVSHRLRRPYMLAMSNMTQTLRMWSTALRYSDIADCSSTKPYWFARPSTSNNTSSCNAITGQHQQL